MTPARRSKHQRIAAELLDLIKAGEYAPGARLPGENEIMRDQRVSQGTARLALALLVSWGVAEARKGSGVYVRDFRPPVVRDASAWPVGEAAGRNLGIDQIEVSEAEPPARVRELLSLPGGAAAVLRSQRFLIDGKPVMVSRSWTLAGARGVAVRFREDVRAGMLPGPDEDTLRLALPPGTPVLGIVRTGYDADGNPVEVSEMTADATAYVFRYEADVDGDPGVAGPE